MSAVNISCDVAHKPTILMVEDEPVLLETIGECLRDWGYNVLEAANAQEGIGLLQSSQVDLVFSDVRMPGGINGFGLARWVRDHRPALPILLTTGYEGEHNEPTASLHNGPILRKPYNLSSLRQLLESLLGDTARRGINSRS